MGYRVKFIGETDLPDGIDWAATRCNGQCVLFVKLSACKCGPPASARRAVMRLAGYPDGAVTRLAGYSSSSRFPTASNA